MFCTAHLLSPNVSQVAKGKGNAKGKGKAKGKGNPLLAAGKGKAAGKAKGKGKGKGDANAAATAIQARFRGNQARGQYAQIRSLGVIRIRLAGHRNWKMMR